MADLTTSQFIGPDGNGHLHMSNMLVSRTSGKIYKSYTYRFVITLLFCLTAIVSAIMWICTSPITTNLENIYGLDIFQVTFCTSLIWFFVYPPMNFAANYVLDELGLQAGIFVGATLTLLGLWIRILSKKSFYFIFAGQFLGALGQPFLLNAPQKLSAVWYSPAEQALATTVASVANPVGVGIGFVLAQLFVSDTAEGNEGLDEVNDLMFYIALIGSVLILPVYFLFKKKPPTPPSKAADIEKYSYRESLKQLWQNKNYLLFVLSIGLVWGSYNVLAAALQPLISPYGFSSESAGDLGAITLVFGLIGSVVWGIHVDRTKRYKRSLMICSILSMVCMISLSLLVQVQSFALVAVITAIYGFFTTPIFPLSFEFCAELSFPVAEAASGGLMVMMTQIVGGLATLGLDNLLEDNTRKGANISFSIIGGLTLVGLVGLIMTKEDLKRLGAEKDENQLILMESMVRESRIRRSRKSRKTISDKNNTSSDNYNNTSSEIIRTSMLPKDVFGLKVKSGRESDIGANGEGNKPLLQNYS